MSISSHRSTRRRIVRRTKPSLDSLEPRRLLSADVSAIVPPPNRPSVLRERTTIRARIDEPRLHLG